MNKLVIPKRIGEDIEKVFSSLAPQSVGNCNWPAEFPYAPQVTFKAFHDGDNLYVKFDVTEKSSAAVVSVDNGEVWTDSCAEFFIALDDAGYYNFETTCIGKMLLGFHKNRHEAVHARQEVIDTVQRTTSLPFETFTERENIGPWTLTLKIPSSALFKHELKSWNGVKAKANFYKCGDNLSTPHFLSWNKIDTPNPDFHRPEFFGTLEFEN